MASRIEVASKIEDMRAEVRKRDLKSRGFFGKIKDVNLVDVYTVEPSSPQLYAPDPREAAFCSHFSMVDAYSKFAIGNEGFITTDRPKDALKCLRKYGLEAKIVSVLQRRKDITGVKLKAFNGEVISFVYKIERIL